MYDFLESSFPISTLSAALINGLQDYMRQSKFETKRGKTTFCKTDTHTAVSI